MKPCRHGRADRTVWSILGFEQVKNQFKLVWIGLNSVLWIHNIMMFVSCVVRLLEKKFESEIFVFNRVLPQSYYGLCTLEHSRMLRWKIFKMPKSTFNNLTVQRHHFRELTDGLIELFLLWELTKIEPLMAFHFRPSIFWQSYLDSFSFKKCQIHSKISSWKLWDGYKNRHHRIAVINPRTV